MKISILFSRSHFHSLYRELQAIQEFQAGRDKEETKVKEESMANPDRLAQLG